jgi:hypothetical protein
MTRGADSIDDLDLLRHGEMDKLFDGIRAPSTLGSFLRAFTWSNVRQLDKAARNLLAALAAHTPLLPGKDVPAFLDLDSMQRRTYGYAKQGSGFGHQDPRQECAGPRLECADGDAVHTAGRAGRVRQPVARWHRGLGARGRLVPA